MEFKSDIMIAQACEKKPIREIAATAGIDEKYLEQYGNYKAKIDLSLLRDLADKPDGKTAEQLLKMLNDEEKQRREELMNMRRMRRAPVRKDW